MAKAIMLSLTLIIVVGTRWMTGGVLGHVWSFNLLVRERAN
jgi:hypothetical protein